MPDLTTPADVEWRPIESAPKDGTRVLLGWAGDTKSFIGWWGPKRSAYGVNYGDAWGDGECWDDVAIPQPTHWRPLPSPPPPARAAAEDK